MEPVAARGVAIVLMCAIASVLLPESIYDDINPDRHLVVVGNQLPLQNQISSSPHRNIDTTIITTQNPSQMSDYDLQDTERLVTERLTTSRNLLNSGKHNTFSTQQQKDIEELETLVKSLSHQLDDVRLEATKRRKERENERIRQENLLSEELLLKRRQEQEELRRKQALELQYKERMAALTRQIDRLKSEIRQESQYLSDRELDQKRDLIYQLQIQINRMREESTLETTVLPIITTNYMIDTAYSWKESTILLWDSFIVWIFGTNELTAVLIQLFMWIVTIILLFIIIYYSYYFNAPTTIDLIDDSNGSEAEIHQEVNEETIVVNETEEINRLRRTIDGLNSEINRLSKSNANTPMRTTVPPIYLNTNNNNNTSNGYHNNGTPYKSTTTTTYSTTSNLANNSFHNNGMYTSNGIHSNEITKNGVHRNGIHSNGVYTNGIHSNGNHVTENENSVKLRDNLDEEDDELSNYYLTNSTSNLIDDELYEINNNNNHINDGNNNNNDKYSNTSAERVKRDMEEQSKSRRDFMKRYESIDNITINETQSDVDLFDRYIDNDRLSVNSFLSETADYYKPFNTRINNRLTTATSSISPRSRSKSLGGSPSGIATPSGSLYNNDDRSSWLNITSTTSKHNQNHECSDDGCKCNDLSTAHGRAHHRQSKSPKKVPGKSPAGTPRKWKL